MSTEQQTSTTVSLTTATTQAPVTTVSSNTPVGGSEISFGGDTVPSNSLWPHMLQQLTQIAWCQFLLRIRNRLAMLLFKLI